MRSRGKKQKFKTAAKVKAKRPRKRINWRPLLWTLLVVNIAAGLLFSSATAVTKVQVSGAPQGDIPRLTQILQKAKNIPWVLLNRTEIEDAVLRRGEVASASFGTNLLNRGDLVTSYEEPVGLLSGTQKLVLTGTGKLVPVSYKPKDLPTVAPPNEVLRPTLALTAPWQPQAVAEVCQHLRRYPWGKTSRVAVDSAGKVTIQLTNAGRVVLGAPEELQSKFTKLEEILKEQPDVLQGSNELNLMTPSKPVVRRKAQP